MTDRVDRGGGGLTGATGDLTPDDVDEPFIPGELREIAGPDDRARVTAEQGAAAPAQQGEIGDPAGEEVRGGPTNMPERASGYGSEHGLSPDDPAYRVEVHPPGPHASPAESSHREREPRIGGDELRDAEDRF